MNPKYSPLFNSFNFPLSNIGTKNRIVMAPMTTWSGNEDGTVSDSEISYYKKRSAGVGMVISACAYIHPQGKGFSGQIGAHCDEMIPSLKKIAETIQAEGSKAILQIYHGGRMSPAGLLPDKQPVSASAVPATHGNASVPRKMTENEIIQTIQAFGSAARRAIEAGFDGVEIHGANTYLIQQFFSPHANRRTDRWGGSLEKRMAFPLAVTDEVLQTVRQFAKKPFLVGYRISPEEIENPGIVIEDTLQLSEKLSLKNLNYLHVSTMNFFDGSIRDPEDKKPRTLMIHEQFGNRIPVIAVGSIRTPDEAIRVLDLGLPLVALGRELLMEPEWVQKILSGEEEQIRTNLPKTSQKELMIPDGLWQAILSRKGWLPVV